MSNDGWIGGHQAETQYVGLEHMQSPHLCRRWPAISSLAGLCRLCSCRIRNGCVVNFFLYPKIFSSSSHMCTFGVASQSSVYQYH
jgi:hypothetical protein